ncbi:kinase-like protein [Hypoxylon sp. FL1857]|nr:kinase-like protein [Hypoxylon sp. FL1857]
MVNISVKFGPFGPTAPKGRRRRRNLNIVVEEFDQLAVREILKIRQYFQDYKKLYRYYTPIANGKHGVAVVIKYMDPSEPREYFVIKRAYDETGNGHEILENEIDWLRRLRGAPHVVQMLNIDPNPFESLSRPTLFLEYVRFGTLAHFIDRASARDRPIPNRVLWSFFTCLARACIAMAWPDRGVEGEPEMNEEFPPDWETKPQMQLIHGDLHPDNILIGDLIPNADEHLIAPILKIADWGLARRVPDLHNEGLGTSTNIFDISRIMRMLISLNTTWSLEPQVVHIPSPAPGRPDSHITTASPNLAKPNFPNLDDDLRDLVIQCTSEDRVERPSLQVLCDNLALQLKAKTAEYYRPAPYGDREQDAAVQNYIQEMIFYPDYQWEDGGEGTDDDGDID